MSFQDEAIGVDQYVEALGVHVTTNGQQVGAMPLLRLGASKLPDVHTATDNRFPFPDLHSSEVLSFGERLSRARRDGVGIGHQPL